MNIKQNIIIAVLGVVALFTVLLFFKEESKTPIQVNLPSSLGGTAGSPISGNATNTIVAVTTNGVKIEANPTRNKLQICQQSPSLNTWIAVQPGWASSSIAGGATGVLLSSSSDKCVTYDSTNRWIGPVFLMSNANTSGTVSEF